MEDALEKATFASLPIITPSGNFDLMMRWMAADGSDISSGTGLTCSGSGGADEVAMAARRAAACAVCCAERLAARGKALTATRESPNAPYPPRSTTPYR